MDHRPDQPPEGKLIEAAARDLDLSIREAARRAGISYGRWRQITSGYQNVSPGSYAEVRAPAKTLARMAAVVNVTPGQLTEAGREDAARILAETPAAIPVPGPALVPDVKLARDGRSMLENAPPDIAAAISAHLEPILRLVATALLDEECLLPGSAVFRDPERQALWDAQVTRGRQLPRPFSTRQIAEWLALQELLVASRERDEGRAAG